MARSCVCRICKAKGNTDTFYRVSDGSGNKYYCSQEEYEKDFNEKQKRKALLEYVALDVLGYDEGQIVNPVMVRKITELNKFYDLEVIHKTFEESKEAIQYWINNKNFANEYGMVSYIMKIVEGNINDVHNKWKHEQRTKEKQKSVKMDLDIETFNNYTYENDNKKKEKDNGILDFLEEDDV